MSRHGLSSDESASRHTTLADLLSDGLFIDGDWVEAKDQDPTGDVRLIQLADVGDGVFRDRSARYLTMATAMELRCTFLNPGDILVARMPEPLGRACMFPGIDQPAVTAVDVCIVRPNQNRAVPRWLLRMVNAPQFRASMAEFVRGTTRQRISRRNLGKLALRVPDLQDQETTAARLDEIEERIALAEVRLKTAHRTVSQLRGAILSAACAGRLTSDWRDDNPEVSADRLHDELLSRQRSAKVRRRASDGGGLTSKVLIDQLPSSWRLVRIGEVLDVATGATPLRKNEAYYEDGTIPWVTSGAVNRGIIDKPAELITPLALQETNVKLFPPGTLLVAMYGEGQTRGRVGELAIEAGTNQAVAALLFDDRTARLRPFVRLFLEDSYRRVRSLSVGGVQPNLNLGMIKDTLLPIPPLEEQLEILHRANAALLAADRIDAQLKVVGRSLDRTSRAVLARVFQGELALSEPPPSPAVERSARLTGPPPRSSGAPMTASRN